MSNDNNITEIRTELIYPHPDNPRKDLGNLDELTESIRKNGIMQNLTVIPGHWKEHGAYEEDGYTLIIGHRRFAAGQAAGLETFPCRIVEDMEHSEQVATMLEENMQRNDLTIWEQANGFQMMLDLGITEEQISERTGFSRQTVRHRLNIAKLNQDELKKKERDENFQLTLKDLYELEKVKDIKRRDRILKEARDSDNMRWLARMAVREENMKENKKKYIELFKAAGIPMAPVKASEQRWSDKWETEKEWRLDDDKLPEKISVKKKDAVYVFWNDNRTVAVITPKKKDRKLSEVEIRQLERQKKNKKLKAMEKEIQRDIREFIISIINRTTAPVKETADMYMLMINVLYKIGANFSEYRILKLWDSKLQGLWELQKDEERYQTYKEWESKLTAMDRCLIMLTEIDTLSIVTYTNEYDREDGEKIAYVVKILEYYGFSLDIDKEQFIQGTHEIWKKVE